MSKNKKSSNLDLDVKVFRPNQLKTAYEKYGFVYVTQNIFFSYMFVIGLVIALGMLYSLSTAYIVILVIEALLFIPIYMSAIPKSKYQLVKLSETTSYIDQMIQSMNDCRMIYPALSQVSQVLDDNSQIKQVVDKALRHIQDAEFQAKDIRNAAVEALSIIEKAYPCEQIKRLHDFCVRAEEIGTDCTKELHLIGGYAQKWETRQTVYFKELSTTRSQAIGEYIFLLFINVFILRVLPEHLTIIHEPIVQFVSTVLISGAFVYALYMQNKLCASLLSSKTHMTEKQVEGAKEYIKNFRKSKTRKSAVRYGVFLMAIMLVTAFITENVVIGALGIIVGVVFLNMHNIVLNVTKKQIQGEVEEAFPQWLFDMCLLTQKDNISVAISESIETAPPILKKELMEMEEILIYEPKSKKAFLGFLQEYEMPGVKKTMEILYSLHIGYAIGQTEQMQKLINRNMKLLDEQEEVMNKRKKSTFALYHLMPLLPNALVTIIYIATLLLSSFDYIFNMVAW